MSAGLDSQAVRTAAPLPGRSSRMAWTVSALSASFCAISQVRSVLPLSTTVMRQGYGNEADRNALSVVTHLSRLFSSFSTGMTKSTSRTVRGGEVIGPPSALASTESPHEISNYQGQLDNRGDLAQMRRAPRLRAPLLILT